MRSIDARGAIIRIAGDVDPRAGAALAWRRARAAGDPALEQVERLVGAGEVVVDVGANLGIFTWRLSRLVGPAGHVHAVEPDPVTARRLMTMAARRGNVTVHEVALSDAGGEARLHVPVNERGRRLGALARLTSPPAGAARWATADVRTTRLDDLDLGASEVRFVKCDVEGHEHAVLQGAAGILERSHPHVLVEIERRHRDDDPRVTFELMASMGYRGLALAPGDPLPLERFDFDEHQSGRPGSPYVHNFLFVADIHASAAPGAR